MSDLPHPPPDGPPRPRRRPPQFRPPPPPPRSGGGIIRRVFTGLASSILLFSVLLNFYFLITFASMATGVREEDYQAGDTISSNRIAILPVEGVIDDEQARFIRLALLSLEANPPAALILRVDSPGGGVAASDQIARYISEFKKKTDIPIVASFGTVAASGGYYISAGADEIVAEPMTITGSIGVIAQAFTAGELLKKIGVQPETIIATKAVSKDVLDWTRDWQDSDRLMLKKFLDSGYDRFLEVVYNGRQQHLTKEQLQEIATGEPLTTKQAIDHHLVDKEGFLDDAIDVAKSRAGMAASARPHVTRITRPVGLLGELTGASSFMRQVPVWGDAESIRRVLVDLSQPRLEYRLNWGG